MQLVAVVLVVVGAAAYLCRNLWRRLRSAGAAGGCGGCDHCAPDPEDGDPAARRRGRAPGRGDERYRGGAERGRRSGPIV